MNAMSRRAIIGLNFSRDWLGIHCLRRRLNVCTKPNRFEDDTFRKRA